MLLAPVPTPSPTAVLDKITLGSWPDWVAAVGTSAAFIVAAVSYWRSVKVRREEQARLIYSKPVELKFHKPGAVFETQADGMIIGGGVSNDGMIAGGLPRTDDDLVAGNTLYTDDGVTGGVRIVAPRKLRARVPVIQLTARIHNGSKELIGPVKVQAAEGRHAFDLISATVDVVDPESDYLVDLVWPERADMRWARPGLTTSLLFRDASGQWWRRNRAEPIEAVHDDPENYEYYPSEIRAANARRSRSPYPPREPKAPLRARWHRFWRKRRGQWPIP